LIGRDIAYLGELLFQSIINDFSDAAKLHGAWQRRIRCPVLRRVIEDAQRPGVIPTAEAFARRVRGVTAARLRRRAWGLLGLIAVLGVAITTAVVVLQVTADNLRLSEDNLRLAGEGKEKDAAAHTAAIARATREREHLEVLAAGEQRARTAEIVRAGDVALANGGWEAGRATYRRALARPDLTDPVTRRRINERILRASIFLDDLAAAREALEWFEKNADPAGDAPAVRLDRAVYLLELAMQDRNRPPQKSGPADHERKAVEQLLQVVKADGVDSADRAVARGLLAKTYPEAEAQFEEALAADPFHPFATIYLISTAMMAGRLDTAGRRVEVWEAISRNDPVPVLHRAFILTLRGDNAGAARCLKRISTDPAKPPHLPQKTLDAYNAVIAIVASIQGLLADALIDKQGQVEFAMLLAIKAPAAMGGFSQTGAFRVPFTPAQREDFDHLQKAVLAGHRLILPDPKAGLEELAKVGSFVPPGLKLYFEGKYLLDVGDKAGCVAALERAANEPSLFDLRRLCLLVGAAYQIAQAKVNPGENEKHWSEARQRIRGIIVAGPVSTKLRAYLIGRLMDCNGHSMAEELAEAAGDAETVSRIRKARQSPAPAGKQPPGSK
jgi:tetratricopeptide (TPR) repeat protein